MNENEWRDETGRRRTRGELMMRQIERERQARQRPPMPEQEAYQAGAIVMTRDELAELSPETREPTHKDLSDYAGPILLIGGGALLLWLLFGKGGGWGFGKGGSDKADAEDVTHQGKGGKVSLRMNSDGTYSDKDGQIFTEDEALDAMVRDDQDALLVVPGALREGDVVNRIYTLTRKVNVWYVTGTSAHQIPIGVDKSAIEGFFS